MGEQAKKIGEKLEGFGENLFTNIGWTELIRDKEIKCKRSSHSKKTHGIDLLMKFSNPYISSLQGVIIECKNRQMGSITKSEINKWIKELINNIECSQSSDELEDVDLSTTILNTGLLLIHANDEFDEDKYNGYLEEILVQGRRNPINIYIASNREIERWLSTFDTIKRIFTNKFNFVYPSINNSNKLLVNHLTLDALYSKYVFAKGIYTIKETAINREEYDRPITQAIVFSFDNINKDAFKYLWSMFKFYQFQDCDEYVFVFYPRKPDDVEFTKEYFLKSLNEEKNINELNKIRLRFVDTRSLSPVDTGR
jgi:hypothetical protein